MITLSFIGSLLCVSSPVLGIDMHDPTSESRNPKTQVVHLFPFADEAVEPQRLTNLLEFTWAVRGTSE